MLKALVNTVTRNSGLTLRLKRPFGKTIVGAVIILVFAVGIAEMLFRNEFIQSYLPTPGLGTAHKNLDLKFNRLRSAVEKDGPVDCIFIGSSMVYRGIDPAVFQEVYKSRTNKDIRCFNFGVAGLSPPSVVLLTKVLIKKYRPKLLIWGTMPMEYNNKRGKMVYWKIASNPWMQHFLGQPNFEGWLTEHLLVYRYYQRLRIWFEHPGLSGEIKNQELQMTPYGFSTSNKIKKDFRAQLESNTHSKFFRRMANFKLSRQRLSALDQMAKIDSQLEIVIVEMPVHPNFLLFYGRKEKDHYNTLAEIHKRAKHHKLIFWTSTQLNLIPDEGWRDFWHMNYKGAQIFTEWLAEKIRKAFNQGLLSTRTI